MPTWLSTILIALATTVLTQATVVPRLEARKRRVLVAHESRDRFNASVLTILTAAERLQTIEVPDAVSAKVREAVQQDRKRWVQQIDDATRYLVDEVERYAYGYMSRGGFRDLAVKYALVTRAVWISGRPQSRRVELVYQLTRPLHGIFFTYWWHRLSHAAADVHTLCDLIDELIGEPQTFWSWLTWMRKTGKRAEDKRAARQAKKQAPTALPEAGESPA